MKHYKWVEFFSNFESQASLNKRNAPLLKTFWRLFCQAGSVAIGKKPAVIENCWLAASIMTCKLGLAVGLGFFYYACIVLFLTVVQ